MTFVYSRDKARGLLNRRDMFNRWRLVLAATMLTAFFGSNLTVTGTSEGLPGVTRSWANFEAAADEAFMARIWAGIHFRFAMQDTRAVARQVVGYVLEHAAQPLHGRRVGQLEK